MNITNITPTNFNDETSTGNVLLKFSAKWCGPCKIMDKALEEIKDQIDYKICVVDVDECTKIASDFGVSTVPAIFKLSNGKIIDRLNGAVPKNLLLDWINKYIIR